MTPRSMLKTGWLIAVVMAPLGVITIKHWMDGLFILAALCSIAILVLNRTLTNAAHPTQLLRQPWVRSVCIAMVSPFLAVLISQMIRQDMQWSYFDSPLRFVLAIPLLIALLAVYKKPIWQLNYLFPFTVILTVLMMPFLPQRDWAVAQPGRITSYFVDPLTFGKIALELAVIGLFLPLSNPDEERRKRNWIVLLKLCALLCGLFLSMRSGSRTGWMAIPIIALLSALYVFRNSQKTSGVLALIVIGVLAFSALHVDSPIKQKFGQALQEFESYQWNAMNKDESISMRISFLRIGFDLFERKPLSGWGDHGFEKYLNDAKMKVYSSDFARNYVLTAGFHNELMTNMVRSGVWGMLSTLLIFLIPLAFFSRQWMRYKQDLYAFCGICFIIFEMTSGLGTEVTNLKFTAAFYSYHIALLFFQSFRSGYRPE